MSKKLGFSLPFVSSEVGNVVRIVRWMLSNAMPVMVGVGVEVVSRSLSVTALCRVMFNLVLRVKSQRLVT